MKKGRISTNCIVFVCTLIATITFASCSADSTSSTGIDESIIVQQLLKLKLHFLLFLKHIPTIRISQ